MKVDELDGALLDYWVACAEGYDPAQEQVVLYVDGTCRIAYHEGDDPDSLYNPTRSWMWGGPIIERERIHLEPFPGGAEYPEWMAFERADGWGDPLEDSPLRQYGDTALIAAMRAYVASKFGEEVPDSAD